MPFLFVKITGQKFFKKWAATKKKWAESWVVTKKYGLELLRTGLWPKKVGLWPKTEKKVVTKFWKKSGKNRVKTAKNGYFRGKFG